MKEGKVVEAENLVPHPSSGRGCLRDTTPIIKTESFKIIQKRFLQKLNVVYNFVIFIIIKSTFLIEETHC